MTGARINDGCRLFPSDALAISGYRFITGFNIPSQIGERYQLDRRGNVYYLINNGDRPSGVKYLKWPNDEDQAYGFDGTDRDGRVWYGKGIRLSPLGPTPTTGFNDIGNSGVLKPLTGCLLIHLHPGYSGSALQQLRESCMTIIGRREPISYD